MENQITLSVIKADVGGYVGHSSIHEQLLEEARGHLEEAHAQDLVLDFHVTACGDDLELITTHRRGVDDEKIHGLAWGIFEACTREARRLKLYGAGQDLLEEVWGLPARSGPR
jgi:fructose 1,6-bisphosphate aldolase/phosphatase